MGIGAITLDSAGSVTAPSKFPWVFPVAFSKTFSGHGPMSIIGYPGGRGFMLADGGSPLRHVTGDSGNTYRTGLLAPYTALTTDGGDKAAATLNVSSDTIANTDAIRIYTDSQGYEIQFVTTLSNPVSNLILGEVLVGASDAATLDNLKDMVNGSGSEGSDWKVSEESGPQNRLTVVRANIEATDNAAETQKFEAKVSGTSYNWMVAKIQTGLGSATFGTSSVFSGGTDGSGSAPTSGRYIHGYGYMRQVDLARSGISQVEETETGGDYNIALSVLANPDEDDDIDHKFWVRSQSSGSKLYIAADILESATTDTDDISNTILGAKTQYQPRYHRPYESGHIPRVRWLAESDGIWYGGGINRMRTYDVGTVTATTDSKEITFSGAYPTKEMEHWTFRLDLGDEQSADEYTIVWVDEANQKAYLERDYEGGGGSGKAYKLIDTRDPFRIFRCEPNLPNQTGPTYFIDGVTSPDERGLTGIYEAFGGVVIFTGTGIWVLLGSPSRGYRLDHSYEGVGCAAGASIQMVDGVLYYLGTDRTIYGWQPGNDPMPMSNPPSQDAIGIQGTCNRINAEYMHNAVSHYDPTRRTIRWFVPLDGDWTNRHAIVLNIQTKSWSLDDVEDITAAATVSDPSGNLRTLAGDIHGNLIELDVEPATSEEDSDGAYGFEPKFTVTSGAVGTVTDSGASFPTSGDGISGVPFLLVDANGDIVRRRVASNTGTVLTPTRYFESAPVADEQGMCGGIQYDIESGRFVADSPALRKSFEALVVTFAKQGDGQFFVGFATNDGTPQVYDTDGDGTSDSFSFTQSDGEEHIWWRDEGRRGKFRILCVEPGCRPAIDNVQMWVVATDRVPA